MPTNQPSNGLEERIGRPYGDRYETEELKIMKWGGFFGVTLPVSVRIEGTTAQTAANFTTPFFIANRSYEVLTVTERHETAVGSAATVMLVKVKSGVAPASGINVITSGINLNAVANTNQSGTIVKTLTNGVYDKTLLAGDSLALVTTGALGSLAGVFVSVLLKAI
jgi:hypothetical protein